MYLRHSLPASALLLSFSTLTQAWIWQQKPTEDVETNKLPAYRPRGASPEGIFGKRQQTLYCPNDRFEQFLDNRPEEQVATFCNDWLGIKPRTITVEATPTITITTSAESTTSTTLTTRVVTTATITQTATTTIQGVRARAANLAAVSEAEVLFQSVVDSGVDEQPTSTSVSPQRQQAEVGLDHACSCKMVDPTATSTATYTVPPVYTTVGVRVVRVVQVTDTRLFTAFTTVTEGAATNPTSTVVAPPADTSEAANASSEPADEESAVPATSEPATDPEGPIATITATALPAVTSLGPIGPVVTALPFSCPADDETQVNQIVGESRFDYLVRCDTALQTEDRIIGSPIDTESATSCAALCSLMNANARQDTCKAASYAPFTDGRSGGVCTLSGAGSIYVESPGSTVVVHTNTLSNGAECRFIESNNPTAVDTSALIASITSAGISVSTPGFVTSTAGGGVSQTYVSANSTDANGFVYWSWYAISASSSNWFAVYSTSWECTATLTRTIVQQPVEPITSEIIVTTIIRGSTTTIISGGSTQIITDGGGGGMSPPTMVPASTTSDNGEITTFFTEATATSTGGAGVIPPTDTPEVGTATVSGSTFTILTTESAGVIPPSSASTELSGNSTTPSTEVVTDIVTVVTSGGTVFTVSGFTSTITNDGGAGVIPPSPTTNGSVIISTLSTVTVPTDAIETIVSDGTLVFTISGATGTIVSTGGSGAIPPESTEVVTIVSSGDASFETSSSTLTVTETDGSGVIPPATTPPPSNETVIIVSSGTDVFTISGSTAITSGTDGSGVIPPSPTDESSSVPATSTPEAEDETVTISIITSGGSDGFTIEASTATTVSTGSDGVITPVPVTSSIPVESDFNITVTIPISSSLPNITTEEPTGSIVTIDRNGTFSTTTITQSSGSGSIPPVVSTITFSISTAERPTTSGNETTSTPTSSGVDITSTPTTTGEETTSTPTSESDAPTESVPASDSDVPTESVSTSEASRTGSFSTTEFDSTSTAASGTETPSSPVESSDLPVSSEASSTVPETDTTITLSSATTETTTLIIPTTPVNVTTSTAVNNTSTPITSTVLSSDLPTASTNETTSLPTTITTVVPPPFDNATTLTSDITVNTPTTVPTSNTTIITTDVPFPTGNSSLPIPTPTGFDNTTTLTTDVPFPTGNSSLPVPTPTGFDNTTTISDLCPTAPIIVTVTSVETTVQLQTTTVVETITAGPLSVAPDGPPSSTSIPPIPTSIVPADLQTAARRPGSPATQPQMDAACNATDNIVANPNFLVAEDSTVPPWTVFDLDPAITVGSEQSPDGNSTIAQFKSAVVGRTLTITQPLTLCPGQQYRVSAMNRQGNVLAGCTAEYSLGNKRVFSVTPSESWLVTRGFFTAGEGVEGASVDLKITASCKGADGIPVTDQEGWMRVEVSGVSVVQDRGRRKRGVLVEQVKTEVDRWVELVWQ